MTSTTGDVKGEVKHLHLTLMGVMRCLKAGEIPKFIEELLEGAHEYN